MGSAYVKSWRQSAFKERNDKISRLRSEGLGLSILSKRFGISLLQLRNILKGRKGRQETQVKLSPFGVDKG